MVITGFWFLSPVLPCQKESGYHGLGFTDSQGQKSGYIVNELDYTGFLLIVPVKMVRALSETLQMDKVLRGTSIEQVSLNPYPALRTSPSAVTSWQGIRTSHGDFWRENVCAVMCSEKRLLQDRMGTGFS